MKIYKKYLLASGYVRFTADGDWAWKCSDCESQETGFDFMEDAEEDLWEHECD